MKIDSKKIEELVKNASNIVITAHKNLDLDALGSILGFYYVASKYDREASLLIEDSEFEQGVLTALDKIKELEYNVPIYKLSETKINKDSLMVIIDTNKKERLQSEQSYKTIKNKIVIDHHVKENIKEKDYLYKYINPEESSSSEIIADLLIDLNVYIPQYISSIMLGGIMVDTNKFYLKTTKNTFDAAGVLKKMGASNVDIQYMFKQDFKEFVARQEIIKAAEIFNNNILISVADDSRIHDNDELAKAADTMLTFNFVEATFVIGKISNKEVGISARSLGKIDVQSVMKQFNGGGHKTEAAAQLKSKKAIEVKELLMKALTK